MTQTLVLQGTFPSLNEVLRLAKSHWSRYAKLKKEHTLSVALEAKVQGLKPVIGMVRVTFYWYEPNRKRDPDNVRHGAKDALDGLVEAGILKDDSARYVPEIRDHFLHDKDHPRVEVEITELIP